MSNKRTISHKVLGVINRFLHLLAYLTFPFHRSIFLHRLRGVKISIIMPEVIIGEGAIIGAGVVLTKNTEQYGIYTGVPAKLIRKRN